MHAGDELGEAERLGQVVVGAEGQPLDEVVGRAAAVSMRIRVSGCSATQRAAHVVAVHLGQVAVQHDDVVGVDARAVERLGAVGRDVDGGAVAAQALGDGGGDARLVLGEQHAHMTKAAAPG